ncbi:MAG: proton-conducting transporter membrane subunit, partial [Clostridia bacterium]
IAIVGFSVKAGMFPLHNWLPAAHSEAPAPASALLSGIIAKAGVFAVIRIIYFAVGTNFLLGTWVQYALIYLSLITIIIGSVMAYREKIFKKRLAYSTVSQISYIILALSIFNQESYDGALLHVLFHATIKTLLFLCVGAIIFKTKKTNVDELSGIGKNMPITMICYTIASLGLVGIPPTCGFYSKWYIAIGALSADLGALKYIIPIVLLISALLTAGYLLPVAFKGFFPPKDFKTEKCEPSFLMLLPMLVLALATFLLVIVK